jgi:hypothetical protein
MRTERYASASDAVWAMAKFFDRSNTYQGTFSSFMAMQGLSMGQVSASKQDAKNFQRNFYKEYGSAWNKVKNQVMGRDAKKIPDQALGNAPNLDISHTSREVAAIASRKGEAWGTIDAKRGYRGTIYISRTHFYSSSDRQVYGTYAHELGNLVGERYLHNPWKHGDAAPRGHPRWDTDVGAAIERRLFPGNLDE